MKGTTNIKFKKPLVFGLILGFLVSLIMLSQSSPSIGNKLTLQNSSNYNTSSSSNSSKSGRPTTLEFTKLEIANDKNEQMKGTAFRPNLCNGCGVLYVFSENKLLFWNVSDNIIPVDVIFVTENGVIDIIERNTNPSTKSIYSSREKVKFVIETNSYYFLNIKESDRIHNIQSLITQGVPYDNSFLPPTLSTSISSMTSKSLITN